METITVTLGPEPAEARENPYAPTIRRDPEPEGEYMIALLALQEEGESIVPGQVALNRIADFEPLPGERVLAAMQECAPASLPASWQGTLGRLLGTVLDAGREVTPMLYAEADGLWCRAHTDYNAPWHPNHRLVVNMDTLNRFTPHERLIRQLVRLFELIERQDVTFLKGQLGVATDWVWGPVEQHFPELITELERLASALVKARHLGARPDVVSECLGCLRAMQVAFRWHEGSGGWRQNQGNLTWKWAGKIPISFHQALDRLLVEEAWVWDATNRLPGMARAAFHLCQIVPHIEREAHRLAAEQ